MELGMPKGGAEMRIYDAAAEGDAETFRQLLQQHPLLLHRVSYACSNKTPLHIATMHGKLSIVKEILSENPQLAEELDYQQSSALHIASARGYVEITRELLSAATDMCLSRDCQGRNPLHLAAVKGHVPILEELVRVNPAAANAKLDRGQTVLHLCIEHNQLESLKVLVPKLSELLYAKDNDGETILHLAVRYKRVQIVQYLVDHMDKNAKNSKGQTPLKILKHSPLDRTTSEIRDILMRWSSSKSTQSQPAEWLTKKRDSIMVVAILIATMAFQAGVTPAGGVWQDNSPQHRAGEAVMANNDPRFYNNFIRFNTVAFVLSLSTILLLISGLPFKHRFFMWALMATIWSSVTFIAVTYGTSVMAVTPDKFRKSLGQDIKTGVIVWIGVMGILLVGKTLKLIDNKSRGVTLWQIFRKYVEGRYEIHNGNGNQGRV